jgi:EmrB/QacA subfamily drug resistance transporter
MNAGAEPQQHDPDIEKAGPDPRRWKALIVLGLVQFMLVLDVTVVNVALPQIKDDLGFSDAGLAWIVMGYVIMAGGFLLLGGRLADIYGRRRLFLLGTGLFAVASIVSGAAAVQGMLIGGRITQGLGEALAAPAALGLIALLFPDGRERMKALGIWGGISGLAGVSGVVISGVLTDLASWRWVFFINGPIALFAMFLVPKLVSESRMVREHARLNFTGAVAGTAGLMALVFGLLVASEEPWGSPQVAIPLLVGLALVGLMFLLEARSSSPLIPMRFFRNRTRVLANVFGLFFTAAFFGYFFLLTLYQQEILDYSPLRGGLAYIPFGLSMFVGVGLGTGLMPKLGVKPLFATGFFGVALGLLLTSGIDVGTSYVGGVLPGMIVIGISSGLIMPGGAMAAMHQVTEQDSSLASGVQNAVQQLGGALGLAVLVTLALRHSSTDVSKGSLEDVADTNGYVFAFRVTAAVLVLCGVLLLILMENISTPPMPPAAGQATDDDGQPSSTVPALND